MDMEMPVVSGIDAIAEIRTIEKEKERVSLTPIVTFSAHDENEQRKICQEANVIVTGHVCKPVCRVAFVDVINKYLNVSKEES
jgi:CheY-like chemotaxis protein